HCRRPSSKNGSLKFSLHKELYRMPALVIDPFRFNMPTNPGQVPLQLATVRIGPRWLDKPGRTCVTYCQTASATINGASGSSWRKTSMPIFWESTNPCCLALSYG